MPNLPWGLLLLFPVVVLCYARKLDNILISYGINKNTFLLGVTALLFASFFSISLSFGDLRFFINIGGFILPLFLSLYFIRRTPKTLRGRVLLTILVLCALHIIAKNLNMVGEYTSLNLFFKMYPLIVGLFASLGTINLPGAVAAVLGGVMMGQVGQYLFSGAFSIAPLWQLGGVTDLNMMLLALISSQVMLIFWSRVHGLPCFDSAYGPLRH